MKIKDLLMLLAVAFIVSCGNAQQKSDQTSSALEIKDVSKQEARTLITEMKDLQIIDVRTDAECQQGMISGAVQINISDSQFESKIDALDKNGKYLVYCKAGGRSARAMQLMKEKGFTHVYNLTGGYSGWQ